MFSTLVALAIAAVAVLMGWLCAAIVYRHRLASPNAELQAIQQRLEAEQRVTADLREQLTEKGNSLLEMSLQFSSASAVAETLKDASTRNKELEREISQVRQAWQDTTTTLAAIRTERDLLKPLESEIQHLRADLGLKESEIASKATDLARVRAEKEAVENNLSDATDRISQLQQETTEIEARLGNLLSEHAQVTTAFAEQRKAMAEKLQLVEGAEQRLSTTFGLLASKALKENQEEFLRMAADKFGEQQKDAAADLEAKKDAIGFLLHSAGAQLAKMDQDLRELEKHRSASEAKLEQQITSLVQLQHSLSEETRRWSKALERPSVKGSWGEIQLRRVAELAGMVEHCDFGEQLTVIGEDGSKSRPDLIVTMPSNRTIAVDAKVSLDAFIRAVNSDSEIEFKSFMQEHVEQIRKHIVELSAKRYWAQLKNSPDLCVAFIPSEALYSAALRVDDSLLDFAATHNVLIATPTTLIALLRAVHYGWREDTIAASAREISVLGRRLYSRLVTLQEHIAKLGKSLGSAVEHYNSVIGSIERGIFPTGRRFKELGAATEKSLATPMPVENIPRQLQSPDWTPVENGALAAKHAAASAAGENE